MVEVPISGDVIAWLEIVVWFAIIILNRIASAVFITAYNLTSIILMASDGIVTRIVISRRTIWIWPDSKWRCQIVATVRQRFRFG
jgi:hypothetical protein